MSEDSTEDSGMIVPPELRESIEGKSSEADLFAEYFKSGGDSADSEKITAAEKWLPGEDEWQGKTNIYPNQARCLAIIRHYFQYFDEIDDLEPFVIPMIEDYEMYRTSVEGQARSEHVGIFKAMFGGHTETEESAANWLQAMTGNIEKGDDE